MNVIKYKKMKGGVYKLVLSNGKEMKVYEDVILKYDLLFKKDIAAATIIEVQEANKEYEAYYMLLNSLRRRAKTVKECHDYLEKKEYTDEVIDKAINKLVTQKYLDDERYAYSYLNEQLIMTKNGPKKIMVNMRKKGLSEDVISRVIMDYSREEQEEKITKIINYLVKTNRSKGPFVLKQKIITKLKLEGFDDDSINKCVARVEFKQDKEQYQKEYNKLYERYKKKYNGRELELFIEKKLYQKGYIIEK